MLGLVTQTSVYHWSIEGQDPFAVLALWHIMHFFFDGFFNSYFLGCFLIHVVILANIIFKLFSYMNAIALFYLGDSEPVKMFERTANLQSNQIINYKCDPSEKWLVLIGIAPGSPEV
jgi:hypothetical protein